jgi:diacylglycerol kinase
MFVLSLTATQESLWWVTLGLAVIVLLAVAAFLTLLVTLVSTIENRVDLIRSTLDQAESNTSDTALIAETADRVDAVLVEGLEHHLFLGRVLDKVRS